MRFSHEQREFVSDKLMDSANYALAGLVFGQFLTDQTNLGILVIGLIIYFGSWIISVRFRKKGRS